MTPLLVLSQRKYNGTYDTPYPMFFEVYLDNNLDMHSLASLLRGERDEKEYHV